MDRAVSDIAREVDTAFMLIGGVSLLLLIGVTATMVLFVVKYHRGRARTTSQIGGNKWLEIVCIVIPTLIVTWMFFVGYRGFVSIRNPPDDAMIVQVTGRQWAWSFHYPDAGVNSQEMVVPVDTPVKAELTAPSNDVIHSFFIPDFRVKEDVLPGRTTYIWFEAKREGDFNIFCAEFCGKGHSSMLSMLHVVSREAYEDWIRDQIKKQYKPLVFEGIVDPQHPTFGEEDLNIDGKQVYENYCASCHGVKGDGSGLPGVARNFSELNKWKKSPKVVDIYRTLMEGIEGTRMRAFPNFTPWENVALAHTVRSLIDNPVAPDARQDYDALVKEYGLDKIQEPKETIPIDKAMQLIVDEARGAQPLEN